MQAWSSWDPVQIHVLNVSVMICLVVIVCDKKTVGHKNVMFVMLLTNLLSLSGRLWLPGRRPLAPLAVLLCPLRQHPASEGFPRSPVHLQHPQILWPE